MDTIKIPFEAYKGTDPYIFVSYSHKDSDKVFPIISEYHKAGFPIWYDEGIDPGNEWPEEIAKALLNCSLFIVFISSSAVASKNVVREINFALTKDKPFIHIWLEETTLNPGLEMQISSNQGIMRFRMEAENFYRKCQQAFEAFKIKKTRVQAGSEAETVRTQVPADLSETTAQEKQEAATVSPDELADQGWASAQYNPGLYYQNGTGPKATVKELENKGTSLNVSAPDWIKVYIANGISAVQAQYKGRYCIIGEESGTNRQFVTTWADSFNAQQRIGAMLRTNIASKYQAAATGAAQSSGGANSSTAAGTGSADFQQEIANSINSVVNVSYSGAQRESDWWSLRRRYDPDQDDQYTDEYTAYVLYTIPKAELNLQIATALEFSVSKDSVLYDITIALARDILLNGVNYLSEAE